MEGLHSQVHDAVAEKEVSLCFKKRRWNLIAYAFASFVAAGGPPECSDYLRFRGAARFSRRGREGKGGTHIRKPKTASAGSPNSATTFNF